MFTTLSFAIRTLRSRLALSVTSVIVLSAGLGFSIAAFSIVNTLLFHPYPYHDIDRLVIVRDHRLAEGAHQGNPIASGDFIDLRRDNRVFTDMAAWRAQSLVLTGSGEPERIEGTAASASFFDVVGARAVLGRLFTPGEDEAGRDDRVVLSHRYWKSRFGLDSSLVGRPITLNGRPMIVVGVISDDDCYPPGVDAWVPLVFSEAEVQERTSQRLLDVARLKPGVSLQVAREDVDRIAARLAHDYPTTNRGRGFGLLELRKEQYEFTEALFLMVQFATLFVLLLGAANVVNLLLAHGIDRQRELGIRLALGASRRQVCGLLLAESSLIACIAGAAGLMAAIWSMPLIHAALPEGIARWIAGWQSIRVDATVAGVTAAATLMTGIALGCITGFHATQPRILHAVREGGRSVAPRLTWFRRVLIVAEVVVAVTLLLGAAATRRGFQEVDQAFSSLRPAEALRFRVSLPTERYRNDTSIVEFQNRLLTSLADLPGVTSVGMIRNEPASNVSNPVTPLTIEGRVTTEVSESLRTEWQTISPGAFEALRLRALRGRLLDSSDVARSARVVVISEALARRFWPGADPIGTRIQIGDRTAPWSTVVGITADLKLNWYDVEPHPTVYVPFTQAPSPQMYVIVRAATDPLSLARPIRAAAEHLDPLQPLSGIQRIDEVVSESVSPVRVLGLLLGIAAILAIVFAATGIYAVLAHWVTARWREFGVRVALGASLPAITTLILRQALTLVTMGILVAAPTTWAVLQVARERLFGLAIVDLGTVAGAAVLVLAVAAAAAIVPAGRLRRLDPASLLQSE